MTRLYRIYLINKTKFIIKSIEIYESMSIKHSECGMIDRFINLRIRHSICLLISGNI